MTLHPAKTAPPDWDSWKIWGWGRIGESYPVAERALRIALQSQLGALHSIKPRQPRPQQMHLPTSKITGTQREALLKLCSEGTCSFDTSARATHSLGKSYPDLLEARSGNLATAVDAVLLPRTREDIAAMLAWCSAEHLMAIPFGGGSSVVGGLRVPMQHSYAGAVSIDLHYLSEVASIDPQSLLATAGAGISGPALEQVLNGKGYTLGHFPQSFQYSTLGGWAATRSAGQYSTGYGKIEEMVQSLSAVSPAGVLETPRLPAMAMGPDLRQLLLGSEGLLGIIDQVTVKIRPLPEAELMDAFLFSSFAEGQEFCRVLLQHGPRPVLLRLSDSEETSLMLGLGIAKKGSLAAYGFRLAAKILGRATSGQCLLLLGFAGRQEQASAQMAQATETAKRHGGRHLPKAIGSTWHKDRFTLPYLRDSLMDLGILIDTFETACTWQNLPQTYRRCCTVLTQVLSAEQIPGRLLCHLSHAYSDGASLYFTLMAKPQPGDHLRVWRKCKKAMTDCLAQEHAAISHHHGIGMDHQAWMPAVLGKTGLDLCQAAKRTLDPTAILNPGKLFHSLPE